MRLEAWREINVEGIADEEARAEEDLRGVEAGELGFEREGERRLPPDEAGEREVHPERLPDEDVLEALPLRVDRGRERISRSEDEGLREVGGDNPVEVPVDATPHAPAEGVLENVGKEVRQPAPEDEIPLPPPK